MIPSEDLKIELVYPDGRGGQHAGSPRSAIMVTHIPTGTSATVELRSQHRSKTVAIEMIESALTSPNFK